MKLTYFDKAPKEVYLAFSGGIDSVVLLHNLIKRKVKVKLIHFDHHHGGSQEEKEFAISTAQTYGIDISIYDMPTPDNSTTLEAFWSKERAKVYQSLDLPLLTGHNLDDAIEWYLMSTFQGTPKLLNYQNRNILRPMLGIRKEEIIRYAKYFKLKHVEDITNSDASFNLRNKVRLNLLPEVEVVFPGISKTVLRLIRSKENRIKEENKI